CAAGSSRASGGGAGRGRVRSRFDLVGEGGVVASAGGERGTAAEEQEYAERHPQRGRSARVLGRVRGVLLAGDLTGQVGVGGRLLRGLLIRCCGIRGAGDVAGRAERAGGAARGGPAGRDGTEVAAGGAHGLLTPRLCGRLVCCGGLLAGAVVVTVGRCAPV